MYYYCTFMFFNVFILLEKVLWDLNIIDKTYYFLASNSTIKGKEILSHFCKDSKKGSKIWRFEDFHAKHGLKS